MNINWNAVPDRFHYFRPAVEICGETRILPYDPQLQRHVPFIERASSEQLAHLAKLHAVLVESGDAPDFYAWCDAMRSGSEDERSAAWHFLGIMSTLEQLAEANVSPFFEASVSRIDDADEQDPRVDTLPEDLRYLVGPALHFGERYQSELQMIRFFEEASPEECEQLAKLAERVRQRRDWPGVLEWLKNSDPQHVLYSWEIDRLFNLMDLCDFDFE